MEDMGRLNNRKILITGGAGFIGGHLTNELVKQGANVTVLDIKINRKSLFFIKKLNNVANLKILNIVDRKKLSLFFEKYEPEYIFHLAADPIVEKSYEEPYRTFSTNIMGTVNILEIVREHKNIKGVIVASSDKAYGKTKKSYKEDSPLRGDHPYDVSKSSADLISNAYYATYGIPVIITRFGNVYGEFDIYLNRIIPGICNSLIKKKTLLVRSDGTYVRDYLYVKDVVNGYLFLLENFKKLQGEAFNFSSYDTLSVLELIKRAEKILDVNIPYKLLNIAKNEIPYQHLNDQKIRKLGWKNNYSLRTTLLGILEWYRRNY